MHLSIFPVESEFLTRPDQEPNDIRVIGEGVRKVYEEVLVPAGMGDVASVYRAGPFYDRTLWLPGYESDP